MARTNQVDKRGEIMNAEERLEVVKAKIELAKQKNGNEIPELDKLEFVAELMSIVNQRLEEMRQEEQS